MSDGRSVLALVPYPLSNGFRTEVERTLGTRPHFLSLAELRRLPPLEALRTLVSFRGCFCVLPLETEDAAAVRPILEAVALATLPARLELITPNLERQPVARSHVLPAVSSLVAASAAGVAAVRSARRELESLTAEPRSEPDVGSLGRVLYVNGNLWVGLKAGGSIGHVAGIVNGLAASGLDVDFASFAEAIGIGPEALVHRLELPRTFGLPFEGTYYRAGRTAAEQLMEMAMRVGPDLIYQRMSIASYSGVLLSRRRQVPLVLEYNGSEVWVAENWGRGLRYRREAALAEEVSLRHAHLIVTVSRALRDDLLGRGVEPDRIVMHPNGVDPVAFDPVRLLEEGRRVREALGIASGATVVGFVGTFGQWHGAEVLARCIVGLASTDVTWIDRNDAHFLFVGDGLRLPTVRGIVEAAPVELPVTFTGLVPQLEAPRYLAACDVLVSPHVPNADGSPFFGSPTKLFEYMAMGKAIVASRLDQIAEVLSPALDVAALPDNPPGSRDDRVGILARPGDEAELAAAIRFAVERPEWRASIGENARTAVEARYTWRRHVDAVLDGLRALGFRS